MTDLRACRDALKQFSRKRVLVVGDLMLDEHIWGTVERISPEAPVMVVQVNSDTDCLPGGAANVANNIRALGGEVRMVGVVGEDEGGEILRKVLTDAGVDVAGVFADSNVPTTRKTRVWASYRHSDRHQVLRIDRETRNGIGQQTAGLMTDYIRKNASEVDAIVVSDYAKGVVSREIAEAVAAVNCPGTVTVSNLKPRNVSCLNGIGVVTLNEYEASAASGMDVTDTSEVEAAGRMLVDLIGCRGLVITRGAHGLSVFEKDRIHHIAPVETRVYDPTGAGDTTISALTLALSCSLDLQAAGMIANCAGGAVVRKVGVATTSVGEIDELLQSVSLS